MSKLLSVMGLRDREPFSTAASKKGKRHLKRKEMILPFRKKIEKV